MVGGIYRHEVKADISADTILQEHGLIPEKQINK